MAWFLKGDEIYKVIDKQNIAEAKHLNWCVSISIQFEDVVILLYYYSVSKAFVRNVGENKKKKTKR